MALNPMQRKSRNSFLLGVTITLLLSAIVILVLLVMLKDKDEELKKELGTEWDVFVLKQDVKAGQVLTKNMFESKKAEIELTPSNATNDSFTVDSWFLQTKNGETVQTDKYGLYLDKTDTIVEVIKNEGITIKDSNGNNIENGEYYVDVNGIIEKVKTSNAIQNDEFGTFYIDKNDKITRLYQEQITGEFYTYKIDTDNLNTNGFKERTKEYVDMKNVPVLARVDMKANTVITSELVVQSDERVTDDTRQQEYNMVILPVDLMTGDYIDIRLMTPKGQDFIVVSKALVDIPMNADGTYIADTIRINLREDEILTMSSAIVEAAGLKGSKLYASRYVEPAMQEGGQVTYTPNPAVTEQFKAYMPKNSDGKYITEGFINIVEEAGEILRVRYSEAAKNARSQYLQSAIDNTNSEEYLENIQDGVETDIGNSLTTRKQYLESLGYSAEEEE